MRSQSTIPTRPAWQLSPACISAASTVAGSTPVGYLGCPRRPAAAARAGSSVPASRSAGPAAAGRLPSLPAERLGVLEHGVHLPALAVGRVLDPELVLLGVAA